MKGNFTQNLKNADKLKKFDNQPKLKKRKVLTVNINRDDLNDFRTNAFMYFKDHDKLINFSYTDYFKIGIRNIYNFFLTKYGRVEFPPEEYLKFYKKRGRTTGIAGLYNHQFKNTETITFLLNEYDTDLYFSILHTFFKNEKKDLVSYSATFFFYDFMKILSQLDEIKYFDPDELQKEI